MVGVRYGMTMARGTREPGLVGVAGAVAIGPRMYHPADMAPPPGGMMRPTAPGDAPQPDRWGGPVAGSRVNGRSRRLTVGGIVVALALGGLTACSESGGGSADGGSGGIPGGGSSCRESSVVACIGDDTTLGTISHTPERAKGTPIRIGMINQEVGAAGAFPELSAADRAAVEFINRELGGVDGHPIELIVCDTKFSPAGSQACSQRMVQEDVAAVTGGIDVFGDGKIGRAHV